jgi:uncharacterized membrane protein
MTEPSAPRKRPLWLIVSVLANMLLIGFIAGALLRAPHRPPGAPRSIDPQTRVLLEMMRDGHTGARTEVAARREAESAAIASIAAEPFSEADMREKFAALRGADTSARAAIHETLTVRLAMLTPEERRRFADALSEGHKRRHRRRKD